MSTIYALSSAPGPAGVAVVRVSGPEAGAAARALAGKLPEARRATLTAFRAADGELLDRGLALWFPGPSSVTGEDVAEFHIHGGRALVRAVLDALAAVPGLRMAEPGDFTRRAFHNGKLDLTQVEAVADLIDAETEGQRRQAARQMEGALGQRLETWRLEVLRALAHVEAGIDFADDEVPADALGAAEARARALVEEMDAAIRDSRRSESLRTGVQVAIVGAPNVGKSSLLNALVGREAAIVSATAGTTRDVVEVRMDLGGVPVTIADTAGLRDSEDEIEAEGIRRARAAARAADLCIAVLDATAWPALDAATVAEAGPQAVFVLNKSDVRSIPCPEVGGQTAWVVSAKTGEGIRSFVRGLTAEVAKRAGWTADPGLTRARHREALEGCVRSLRRFLAGPADVALRAEDLRLASRELGRITGRVDVEELLEVVFRDFCIGK